MDQPEQKNQWDERLSQEFIDYGRYFVPERDRQIKIIVSLLPCVGNPTRIIELCCGEGLLVEAILKANPNACVIGFDGSQEMLNQAGKRLVYFGDRFRPVWFDLAEKGWRVWEKPVHAVVTSLAVHHLIAVERAALFKDIYKMLVPGGSFIIADIIDPVHRQSRLLAAESYDRIVKQRAIALDGDTRAFDFFQREGWNIFHYLDPQDIDKPSPLFEQLQWLAETGLVGVDVFWLLAGHAIFGGWKPGQ